MNFQERTNKYNLKAIFHRHGVDSLEEYEEQFRNNKAEWARAQDELTAEMWINLNMMKRGRTINEYIRAVSESKIRD